MQIPAKIVSLIALAATIVPSMLCFAGAIGHNAVMWTALIGTALWFAATPLWMGRKLPADATEVEL